MTETKYRPLHVKTVPSNGSGVFTGLASTYEGEPDFQNDVVAFGAFAEDILRWRALGDYPPVLWNHDSNSAQARVGKITSMQEISEGLLISAKLNLKNERAVQIYEALLNRSVDQLSIGYGILSEGKRKDGVNVLKKLTLIEVSITPIPANPRARVLSVKARGDDRDAKTREAQRLTNLVAYRAPTVPGLVAEVKRAAKAVVDDEGADVSDVRDAVKHVVSRRATLQKYAVADAENARKWGSYTAKRAVEELVAETSARESNIDARTFELIDQIDEIEAAVKGAKRNTRVPNPDNEIEVRQHLRQHHANDINDVQSRLDRFSLSNMNAMHARFHRGGGDHVDDELRAQVDALVHGVALDVAKSRADDLAFKMANDAVAASGRAPGFDPETEAIREKERADREAEQLQQRWKLRELEADRREANEAIARDRAWMKNVDAYHEEVGAIPIERSTRKYAEPNVIDKTGEVEPDTFRISLKPEPDELVARLTEDELKETR
jgi:HK97 family phage prohead protease